jgi:hypothetical protein
MIKVIEPRHDFVLDDVVKGLGFKIITPLGAIHALGGGYFPAVRRIEPLVPPSVANGQICCAIECGLHP